jgi:hypothetical protein
VFDPQKRHLILFLPVAWLSIELSGLIPILPRTCISVVWTPLARPSSFQTSMWSQLFSPQFQTARGQGLVRLQLKVNKTTFPATTSLRTPFFIPQTTPLMH